MIYADLGDCSMYKPAGRYYLECKLVQLKLLEVNWTCFLPPIFIILHVATALFINPSRCYFSWLADWSDLHVPCNVDTALRL